MIKELKNKEGFSLIELLVSLGIIATITVLFMANYRNSNQRTDLVMTAQKIVADIHAAQNNSLGLVKYNGEVPAGGWGISFDLTKNYYMLFADLNSPETLGYLEYDPSLEGEVAYGARIANLSSGVIITSLKVGNNSASAANVTFLPPDPKTNIYSSDLGATSTVLEIKIKEAKGENTKTIRVNFLGLAEVID